MTCWLLCDSPLPLSIFVTALVYGIPLLGFAYFVFWLWMLVHCILYEPDKFFWIWLLVIAWFPGAIIYAAIRYFPAKDFVGPRWLRRSFRSRELRRLEIATQQIGNAHQFVLYADALRELGLTNQARVAYAAALQKDSRLLPALWGAAQLAVVEKKPAEVRDFTQRVLDIDPQYKFGDVSLAYGRALEDLGETDAAREHFARHVRRWRHPEAVYRLATLYEAAGDRQAAREQAEALLRDLATCPPAIARKHGRWQSRARQLLKR